MLFLGPLLGNKCSCLLPLQLKLPTPKPPYVLAGEAQLKQVPGPPAVRAGR